MIYLLPVIESCAGDTAMNASRLRARYRHILGFFARATAGFIFWEVLLPRLGL